MSRRTTIWAGIIRLIIIRHGETEENARNIIMGQMQGTLSAKGIRQAKRLALKLKNEKIDAIFSSDLCRARETTKEIARYHRATVVYTKELREQSYGVFQGRPRSEFFSAQASKKAFTPQGGESLRAMRKRISAFLHQLERNKGLNGKCVLISAHAGVVRCSYSVLKPMPIKKSLRLMPKNTGMLIFDVSKKGSVLVKDDMFQ